MKTTIIIFLSLLTVLTSYAQLDSLQYTDSLSNYPNANELSGSFGGGIESFTTLSCSDADLRWIPIANAATSETDNILCEIGSVIIGVDPNATIPSGSRLHTKATSGTTVRKNLVLERDGIATPFALQLSTNASGIPICIIGNSAIMANGITIQDNGNLGIGTYVAGKKLDVAGEIRAIIGGANAVAASFGSSSTRVARVVPQLGNTGYNPLSVANDLGIIWSDGGAGGSQNNTAGFFIGPHTGTTGRGLRIKSDGNVGIGLANPAYKLDVCGTIRSKEVIVNLTGCDFVFENDYKLMPLNELEAYIKQNKHLPEIAPAKEMETEEGFALGQLQSKLLQKVEELTLYVIDLKKENEFLKNEILLIKKD